MTEERFSRTRRLIGEGRLEKLKNARVAVFGIGGVGGHAAEALVRAGIGSLDLFDADVVDVTNLNRQIVALGSTIGMPKAEVMAARARDINPECRAQAKVCFYDRSTENEYPLEEYDFVVDAIDTVTSKVLLARNAGEAEVPLISCMGTGNKLYPELLQIGDLYKTSVCPLARVMRKLCKEAGIKKLPVVYSTELPITPAEGSERTPASISVVPPVAGMMLAGFVVRNLIGERRKS